VGFAADRSQLPLNSVTWVEAIGAVDLVSTAVSSGLWEIVAVPKTPQGEFEIDLELLEDYFGYKHAGVWGIVGTDSASHGVRYSHFGNVYDEYQLTGAPWSYATYNIRNNPSTTPSFNVGDRRTFRLRWDTLATGLVIKTEFSVDDTVLFTNANVITSIRPAVFVYRAKVRVHSIKVWDAPRVAFQVATFRGYSADVGRLVLTPPGLPSSPVPINRGQVLGQRNIYQGGMGRVAGTVKVTGTPNAPVHRKVNLIDEATSMCVQSQWSDAITGAYTFDNVDLNAKFTVVSYDHLHNYRAVIADNIIPEVTL